jgi:mono/diheme cytochrome c family protein
MKRLTRVLVATLAVLPAVVVTAALGRGPSAEQPALPDQRGAVHVDGAHLFKTWCASCHGVTAQGNGPLAPALKARVPDLTQIADKNGGLFPRARVARIIDGRDVVSHGDPEMPVWGTAFKSTEDGYSEASVRARIEAVVHYLETIQHRNAH